MGRLLRRIAIGTRDELAGLGASLNLLADDLEQTVDALARERDRSEAVLGSMQEGVIAVGNDLRIVLRNLPTWQDC